ALIDTLMRRESATSFTSAKGQDLDAYADALITRFADRALNHRLAQIAMDGSQKIPQRWLETLAAHQERGEVCPAILTALAAWLRHVRGVARTVDDPLADVLASLWREAGVSGIAAALFGDRGLFAHHWHASEPALAQLTRDLARS